ncbi:MAG: hypothetical protein ACK5R0_18265 [Bacteroidota bacterium]
MILGLVLILIATLTTGFIHIWRTVKGISKKLDFAVEYREKLIEQANSYFSRQSIDNKQLSWLTKNSDRIQNQIGRGAVIDYKPAYQNYLVSNYHLIINTIPKFSLQTIHSDDVTYADNCLLRHIGNAEEAYNESIKRLKNPLTWFREGFVQLTSLPIYILNWFGILTDNSLNKITTSLFYRTIVGIGGLVAFASGLVTIIQGRKDVFGFIREMFGK